MDPKLTMIFILIGTIITLSHVGDKNLAKREHLAGRW
jgi:hypothetical protein